MNNNDNKDLIQVEDEVIVEFVKVTPYPNYEEMLEKLYSLLNTRDLDWDNHYSFNIN